MRRAAFALLALAAAACGEAPGAARFGLGDCRRVAVRAPDGRALVGIEDLAVAPDGARLILSAYDRRDPGAAPGGLFAVSLAALGGAEAEAVPLLAGGPDRPHGLAVSADGRIAVVARDGVGGGAVLTGRLDGERAVLDGRIDDAALCRANDLAFADGLLLATLDRRDCGPSLRDLRPGARTGRLAALGADGATILRDGLAFPNGLADLPGGPALAETRAARIRLPDGGSAETPGAPDNLTAAGDGALLAALHPSTFALFLARSGLPVRPGARVARVDPATGAVALLFDDPDGALFSAATVAAPLGAGFVAGSALDAGLLVCGDGP